MKREGLQTVKEAERYFMHRMTDVVNSLGKTLVGWDELLDLNVKQDNTIIMWWRHERKVQNSLLQRPTIINVMSSETNVAVCIDRSPTI